MNVEIPCPCPGTPHPDGDTVTLRDTLDFVAAMTIRNAVRIHGNERATTGDSLDSAEMLAVITQQYVLLGVESWTLVDEKGKAVPVGRTAIRERLLADIALAGQIADEADNLYSERYLLPLFLPGPSSSPAGPTNGSTSARNGSSPRPRKPSSPSSTSTTPTGGIVPTTT